MAARGAYALVIVVQLVLTYIAQRKVEQLKDQRRIKVPEAPQGFFGAGGEPVVKRTSYLEVR